MSFYYVTIGKNEYQVNLNGKQATVDGRPVNGNLQALNTTGLHILRNDVQAVELYMNAQDSETMEVLVGSRRVLAKVETLQRRIRKQQSPVDNGTLTAPMPGLVVDVLVQAGQEVEQGQTLVVLESMKMQMQLRAAVSGIIQNVPVQIGSQVEKGNILVRIETPR